jgi:hypothetical protein
MFFAVSHLLAVMFSGPDPTAGLSAKSFPQLGGDVGRAGAAVVQGVSGRQALVV